MSTKKVLSTNKKGKPSKKTTKPEKVELKKISNSSKNRNLSNEDKMLEKVEKYVDKNREKTSQEMMERKSKRPTQKFQEWDLEVMISRIDAESKPKEKTKEVSKWILYLVYTIIVLAIIIFCIKYFFNSNMPQIS